MRHVLEQGGHPNRVEQPGRVVTGGPVGAQAHRHARLQQRPNGRDARAELQVRDRVVDDGRTGGSQTLDIAVRDPDRVGESRELVENAETIHERDQGVAVELSLGGDLHPRLECVDVVVDTELPGEAMGRHQQALGAPLGPARRDDEPLPLRRPVEAVEGLSEELEVFPVRRSGAAREQRPLRVRHDLVRVRQDVDVEEVLEVARSNSRGFHWPHRREIPARGHRGSGHSIRRCRRGVT